MITLNGTYADECNGPLPDVKMVYQGRLIPWGNGKKVEYFNPIGEKIDVEHGDALLVLGQGTWFAHYKPVKE